ncbi:MAG: AraC family transcriptional regulator [Leptolyngbya sp. SIO1D8]|nr:AraC family transcriptional regulator [Leptolyngbya sp. SIO1D8]
MSESNQTFDDKSCSHQMLTSIVANTFNYAVSRGLDMEQIKAATGLTRTELLTDSMLTIEAISSQLGYSDDRSFRRAFKRWTGHTPSEFRRGVI